MVASISKIKPGKAGGPDGISGKVLKSCCHQLKCVLTRLFQALLQAGTVDNFKNLGTYIDSKLSFVDNTNNILKKNACNVYS